MILFGSIPCHEDDIIELRNMWKDDIRLAIAIIAIRLVRDPWGHARPKTERGQGIVESLRTLCTKFVGQVASHPVPSPLLFLVIFEISSINLTFFKIDSRRRPA